jgi:hypothetical protein
MTRAGVHGELGGEGANTAARTNDQHGLAGQRPERRYQGEPGAAGRRERRRHHRVEAVRHPGQRRLLSHGDVLGVGSCRSERGDQQLAEQLLAAGKSPRPLAGPLDHARTIGAEYHRECRRRRPPGARGKRGIHRVHARGPHPEQDLPRSRFRRRYLAHHRGASVFTDGDSAHGDLLADRSSQTAVHAAHAGCLPGSPARSRQAGTFSQMPPKAELGP